MDGLVLQDRLIINTDGECVDDLSELDFPLITNDTSTLLFIITNGKVIFSFNVEYNAAEFVEIRPGFEVENGAVFHAHIAPCVE